MTVPVFLFVKHGIFNVSSLQSFGYISDLYKGTEEFHTECRDIIFFASAHSSCCLLLQEETWGFLDSPSIHQNTGYIAAKHLCWEISQKELSLMTLPSALLDCCYVYTRGEEDVGNGIKRSFPQHYGYFSEEKWSVGRILCQPPRKQFQVLAANMEPPLWIL